MTCLSESFSSNWYEPDQVWQMSLLILLDGGIRCFCRKCHQLMYIPLDMWEQVSSLVLYVSDILVGKLLSWVFPWAKQIISKTFDIKDLDKAPSILGIEINKKKRNC